jgi:hypothetical protein
MRLRRTAVVAAITMLGAGTGAAVVAGPGGAQVAIDNQAHLTVNKAVVGTPPDGTQYTVGISCSQNGGPPTTSAVIMSGPGNVADADYLLDGPVVCTVTEPATGGATASFACTATDNAQCSGNVVTFNSGGATGTITVTNTFADPITVEVAKEVVQRAPTAIVTTHRTAG